MLQHSCDLERDIHPAERAWGIVRAAVMEDDTATWHELMHADAATEMHIAQIAAALVHRVAELESDLETVMQEMGLAASRISCGLTARPSDDEGD